MRKFLLSLLLLLLLLPLACATVSRRTASSGTEEILATEVVYKGSEVLPNDPVALVTVSLQALYTPAGYPEMRAGSCTGTLVAASAVVTAAHCLQNFKEHGDQMRMQVTYKNLDGSTKSVFMKKGDFEVHPQMKNSRSYDVALIHLPEPLTNRVPAELATEGSFRDQDEVLVAGYGKNGGEMPTTKIKTDSQLVGLQKQIDALPKSEETKSERTRLLNLLLARTKVLMDIGDRGLLQTKLKGEVKFVDGLELLVLSSTLSAHCEGDSGGPSYVIAPGPLRIVGVHIFGDENACEKLDTKGIQKGKRTSVDAFIPLVAPWIEEKLLIWKNQKDT